MLSVLIETRNDEERLARTLASLVGGVVEGMVREVIVCDLGSTDQTAKVAEHAGCRYLTAGGIGAGIAAAKGDWLLLLEPGARLVEGWADVVADHVAHSEKPARFSQARGARASWFTGLLSRRRTIANGLIITCKQAAASQQIANGAQALAASVRAVVLPADIWPVPGR
ncbi:glycosyltransferase [Mesorhizobium sp. 1M-11]|uniref:glycosyltransferase n=1 Tax=Mesorhizobium sp. 1M-11 TaxID=1529006 RepID=UPI0006C75914|nr:glycosyltransferase [Mesorhizobium sp. 1M-11]